MSELIRFPKNFLWGASTSSYQVEGNNELCDWFQWEKQGKLKYRCGTACDSYKRFEEDFAIAESLGHNAHRFSIEWSRIQPEKDRFDQVQIEHYRKVLSSLKDKELKPILTLHHFTNPCWFAELGGWENKESSEYFARYIKRIVKEFSCLVEYWITINEPLVLLYNGYYTGIWPPGYSSLSKVKKSLDNLILAHTKAYEIIHSYSDKPKVSIAKHLRFFCPCSRNNLGQNNIPVFLRRKIFNYYLIEELLKRKSLDFLGINYYTGDFVKFAIGDIFGKECYSPHHKYKKNNLGWFVSPDKFTALLVDLKKYGLPVIITENGTTQDRGIFYKDYLKQHILSVSKALLAGVDVKGYMWWSLLDNYEWDKGFDPKFGLVSIDEGLNRHIKPFAYQYKDIIDSCR